MFDAQWAELQRLWEGVEVSREEQAACRLAVREQAYTVDCLQLLSKQIARLQPRQDAAQRLRTLIEERAALIERMQQFEQSASNPNRLFGSSFQLLQEEKFRKTAYPNLIKLEAAIDEALLAWHALTGDPFILHGIEWRVQYEEEKAGRWINEAFFEFKRKGQVKTSEAKHETPSRARSTPLAQRPAKFK